jgi:positive regulator of sigma E activity
MTTTKSRLEVVWSSGRMHKNDKLTGPRGNQMTQQVHNQQGRIIKPMQAVIFISALLVFVFTVIYRMVKSANLNSAMATLLESLLIVAFFIFLGILLSYLIYFIYQRFSQGVRRPQVYTIFDHAPVSSDAVCTPASGEIEPASNGKSDSGPDPEA